MQKHKTREMRRGIYSDSGTAIPARDAGLGSISCLTEDSLDSALSDAVRMFLVGVSFTRSVDGYLIKLTTLIQMVLAFYGGSLRTVEKVLSCREVVRALEPLANHIDEVMMLVSRDPRHKFLRPYLSLIVDALAMIPRGESKRKLKMGKSFPEHLDTRSTQSLLSVYRNFSAAYSVCGDSWYKYGGHEVVGIGGKSKRDTNMFKMPSTKNMHRVRRGTTKTVAITILVSVLLAVILLLL